jgi:hypothetical protein
MGGVASIRTHSLLTNSSKAKLAPERLRKAEATTFESMMSLSMSYHGISHRMFEVGSPDSSPRPDGWRRWRIRAVSPICGRR